MANGDDDGAFGVAAQVRGDNERDIMAGEGAEKGGRGGNGECDIARETGVGFVAICLCICWAPCFKPLVAPFCDVPGRETPGILGRTGLDLVSESSWASNWPSSITRISTVKSDGLSLGVGAMFSGVWRTPSVG